jgi:hypothetical protein
MPVTEFTRVGFRPDAVASERPYASGVPLAYAFAMSPRTDRMSKMRSAIGSTNGYTIDAAMNLRERDVAKPDPPGYSSLTALPSHQRGIEWSSNQEATRLTSRSRHTIRIRNSRSRLTAGARSS